MTATTTTDPKFTAALSGLRVHSRSGRLRGWEPTHLLIDGDSSVLVLVYEFDESTQDGGVAVYTYGITMTDRVDDRPASVSLDTTGDWWIDDDGGGRHMVVVRALRIDEAHAVDDVLETVGVPEIPDDFVAATRLDDGDLPDAQRSARDASTRVLTGMLKTLPGSSLETGGTSARIRTAERGVADFEFRTSGLPGQQRASFRYRLSGRWISGQWALAELRRLANDAGASFQEVFDARRIAAMTEFVDGDEHALGAGPR
jgi:hypothetical protein